MAKKKNSSKKNMIKILMDFLTLCLGAVVLGFVALPHISFAVSSVIGKGNATTSGFELISFEKGDNISVAVVLLLLVIFASMLIAFALLKMLVDGGVIKNKTISKVASFGMIVSALWVAGFAVANCITIPVACADKSFNLGNLVSTGIYAVWGSIIVNAILGICSLITSSLSLRK